MYTNVTAVGNKLFVREIQNGRRTSKRIDFRPILFVPSDKQQKYKDIRGHYNLAPVEFESIADMKDFLKSQSKVSNSVLFGMIDVDKNYIQKNYPQRDIDKTQLKIQYIDIEVASDDGFPDPEFASKEVNAITVYDTKEDKFFSWGIGDWDPDKSILAPEIVRKVVYQKCSNEDELLLRFMRFYCSDYPDIVTGWNSNGFDIPYLYNRITNLFGEEAARKMSPCNKTFSRKKKGGKYNKEFISVTLGGVSTLDYLELYQKHTFKAREANTLGHIAFVELKEQKLSYDEAGSLHGLYKTNFQKYIDYNIKDVYLVVRLDRKLQLIDLVVDVAYYAGVNYDEVASPVRVWDSMIYDHLMKMNIVIPSGKDGDSEKEESFRGAFVKDPVLGLHGWTVSFDLTSLYPSIIRQWNLGPETIQDEPPCIGLDDYFDLKLVNRFLKHDYLGLEDNLKKNNICISANGMFFDVSKASFMNDLMKKLFDERASSKKKAKASKKEIAENKNLSEEDRIAHKSIVDKFSTREQALKVLLNSGYGAIGNEYFRFFDVRVAEAVTITGQLVTLWIEQEINSYMNRIFGLDKKWVVYIDTDSVYVNVDEFVNRFTSGKSENEIVDFLDNVCKKIQSGAIEPGFQKLQRIMNCREQLMDMKREVIASSGFWRSKKNYALRVLDSEGVRETDIKIMGIEAVKSTFPEFCRNGMKQAINIILEKENNDVLIEFVENFKKKFFEQEIESICGGSGLGGLDEYMDSNGNPISGTPWHIKAAIVYNKLITSYNLENRFEKLKVGDKIKLIALKKQNPTKCDWIAFNGYLPKELNLERYIDKDVLFEKNFLNPIRSCCATIGYNVEKQHDDLSSFFF